MDVSWDCIDGKRKVFRSAIFIEMKGRFWYLFDILYIYKEVGLISQSNIWSVHSMKDVSGMNVER